MKPAMVWQVQPGDGDRVGAVVDKMVALGAPATARVFLNGRPAEPSEPVDPGDRVELWPRRTAEEASDRVRVIAQRDGVILVEKPAGLPTDTTRSGEDSVVSALLAHFKGGKIHIASRLDVGVSGVLIATLGRDANRRVEHRRQQEQLTKIYLAIASGRLEGEGEWTWRLGKRKDRGGRHRSDPEGSDPKEARTRWRALAHCPEASLIRLEPMTGRMHQLRAHAALAGHPLYGDGLYGGPTTITENSGKVSELGRIALHAWHVGIPHLAATSPVPESFQQWWVSLGGASAVWQSIHPDPVPRS